MKETYYFPHDYSARNDDKILEIRAVYKNTGYAIYFYCLETMCERGDGHLIASIMGGLSLGYGVSREWLLEFLEFCVKIGIFKKNDKGYYSERIIEHLNFRANLSKAGIEGANKRWGGHSPPNGNPNANEMKVNEMYEYSSEQSSPKESPLKENLKWQMEALEAIKLLNATKKSSIFKCFKLDNQKSIIALNDCRELGKLNELYFLKVYNELKKREKSSNNNT